MGTKNKTTGQPKDEGRTQKEQTEFGCRNNKDLFGAVVLLISALIIGYCYTPPAELIPYDESPSNPERFTILSKTLGDDKAMVVEDREKHQRFLVGHGCFVGGIHLDQDKSTLFTTFALQSVAIFANPKAETMLQIGLGAGSASRELLKWAQKPIKIDAVDTNTNIARYAKIFFDFKENGGKVHIMDGKAFLHSPNTKKYDIIIHDVFAGGVYAGHLYTQEVFQRISEIMNPDSILAVNFLGALGTKSPLAPMVNALDKTLKSVFSDVRVFKDSGEKDAEIENLVYFASKKKIVFQIPEKLKKMHKTEGDTYWVQEHFLENEVVLNDDHASIIKDGHTHHLRRHQTQVEEGVWDKVHTWLPRATWAEFWREPTASTR